MNKNNGHTNHSEINFASFAAAHQLTVQHKSQWRMCTPKRGYIHALPHTLGTLRATDGMLCYIEFADGSLFCGHIDYFVKDRTQAPHASTKQRSASSSPKSLLELLTAAD